MAITWTENTDSRAMIGPSVQIQQNSASFGASDYVTGGYLVDPQWFGLRKIRGAIVVGLTGNALGYLWEYNPTASNLIAYQPGASNTAFSQTASNTDFSGNGGSLQLLAFGF
jgi:hypothetical protein